MGRPKGRRYIPVSISVSSEQMKMLEQLPNQSAVIRGLLDYYSKTWHPLVAEYLEIIKDIKENTTWNEESKILELVNKIEDSEYATRLFKPFLEQLKRLKELERQIPKEYLPFGGSKRD